MKILQIELVTVIGIGEDWRHGKVSVAFVPPKLIETRLYPSVCLYIRLGASVTM